MHLADAVGVWLRWLNAGKPKPDLTGQEGEAQTDQHEAQALEGRGHGTIIVRRTQGSVRLLLTLRDMTTPSIRNALGRRLLATAALMLLTMSSCIFSLG